MMDSTQAKIMQMLPFIFTIFTFTFPSGLTLYWVTSNILSIAQQQIINRIKTPELQHWGSVWRADCTRCPRFCLQDQTNLIRIIYYATFVRGCALTNELKLKILRSASYCSEIILNATKKCKLYREFLDKRLGKHKTCSVAKQWGGCTVMTIVFIAVGFLQPLFWILTNTS